MKGRILSIFFSSVLSLTSYAQTNPHDFSLAVSLGPSIPLGHFASKDTSSNPGTSGTTAGWAKMGEAIDISVDYKITSKIGVALLAGWQQNEQDKEPRENQLKAFNEGRSIRTIINKEHWRIGKIMIGGSFETPISTSGKLNFQSKILIGACKTAIPAYNYRVILLPSNELPTAAKSSKIPLPWAFCYQGNIGLKYLLSKKLSLLAELNYFGAMPTHKYKYYSSLPDQGNGTPVKKKYSLDTVNPMIGISFAFK